jgi:hypothetical protein
MIIHLHTKNEVNMSKHSVQKVVTTKYLAKFQSPLNLTRSGEVYSTLHHVIKFVSVLRQVGGFLRALRFPPPIKLNATI